MLLNTQRSINDIYAELKRQREQLDILISLPASDTPTSPTTNPPTMPGQAANQVRNGSFAHSVQSWFPNQAIPSDGDYECAWWYSHSDAANTAMDLTSSATATSAARNAPYTVSNYTSDRTLDASSSTLGETIDVLCQLIDDLKERGIL